MKIQIIIDDVTAEDLNTISAALSTPQEESIRCLDEIVDEVSPRVPDIPDDYDGTFPADSCPVEDAEIVEESEPEPAVEVQPPQELDAAGHHWDGRVHSEGKTLKADKTWRMKRGIDPDTLKTVLDSQGSVPIEGGLTQQQVFDLIKTNLASGKLGAFDAMEVLRANGQEDMQNLPPESLAPIHKGIMELLG